VPSRALGFVLLLRNRRNGERREERGEKRKERGEKRGEEIDLVCSCSNFSARFDNSFVHTLQKKALSLALDLHENGLDSWLGRGVGVGQDRVLLNVTSEAHAQGVAGRVNGLPHGHVARQAEERAEGGDELRDAHGRGLLLAA
jgi:hypothetical protein